MTADQFLASLRPLLAAGPRGQALAIEEIDLFLVAVQHYRDNPAIGPAEVARLRQARVRIEAGREP